MRTDENGRRCPETLGEYRDMLVLVTKDHMNPALMLLDMLIDKGTRDYKVDVPDIYVRMILQPLLIQGLVSDTTTFQDKESIRAALRMVGGDPNRI